MNDIEAWLRNDLNSNNMSQFFFSAPEIEPSSCPPRFGAPPSPSASRSGTTCSSQSSTTLAPTLESWPSGSDPTTSKNSFSFRCSIGFGHY